MAALLIFLLCSSKQRLESNYFLPRHLLFAPLFITWAGVFFSCTRSFSSTLLLLPRKVNKPSASLSYLKRSYSVDTVRVKQSRAGEKCEEKKFKIGKSRFTFASHCRATFATPANESKKADKATPHDHVVCFAHFWMNFIRRAVNVLMLTRPVFLAIKICFFELHNQTKSKSAFETSTWWRAITCEAYRHRNERRPGASMIRQKMIKLQFLFFFIKIHKKFASSKGARDIKKRSRRTCHSALGWSPPLHSDVLLRR